MFVFSFSVDRGRARARLSCPGLQRWAPLVVFSTSGQPQMSAGVWLHVCVWFRVALIRDKNSLTHSPTHSLTSCTQCPPLFLLQVRELAQQIDPGLEVVTCGSYRRGKLTCGDVDILVTHSDGRSHRGVLPKLTQEGRESGECVTERERGEGGQWELWAWGSCGIDKL